MSWQAIPAIKSLQADLTKKYPNRKQPDWIIGDPDHSSRVSDHNPAPDGDVHAIDIRLGGDLVVAEVLKAVIGDTRVKYVIHNSKIYSRTYGWVAHAYYGVNPHKTHIHVSFRYETELEKDTSAWFDEAKVLTRPVPIDLSIVRGEFHKYLGRAPGKVRERTHVKRFQRALNEATNAGLKVDGIVGPKLVVAWQAYETRREVPGLGWTRIPDKKSLGALVNARWRMVA